MNFFIYTHTTKTLQSTLYMSTADFFMIISIGSVNTLIILIIK